QRLEKAFGDSL
ncbi:hypothetical protein D018_5061B, partial [Vibrio parahaemolyticus VP2007-007]